jgi:hypothetical protein
VRAFDDGEEYIYEYGNMRHAEEHYDWEKTAEIWSYKNGNKTLVRSKVDGVEKEIQI